MKSIRELSGEQDFTAFVEIISNAYPGINIDTEEQKKKSLENYMKAQVENPLVKFYGVFEEDKMLGAMKYFDFNMKLLSTKIKVGGIGSVAVDLLHKKEKVAKEILTHFIQHYRSQGASMVILYPFNTEFYKKMGFGFGTSLTQYRVKPANLPKGMSKSNIVHIKKDNVSKVLDCYNRMVEKTNGLIEKQERDFAVLFNNPKVKIAAFENNGQVKGYIIYEFKSVDGKNIFLNDIVINQILFENQEALMELITFLNSQSDQVNRIIFNIQDEDFRFMLEDPTDDSYNILTMVYHECSGLQGTGIMYRVIDIKKAIKELENHNFNNESCKLKLTIKDSFILENDGSLIIHFNNGYPSIIEDEDYDVEIKMNIADFSSLLVCAVTFKSLHKYGRAWISDEGYLKKINNIFASDQKPICMTMF